MARRGAKRRNSRAYRMSQSLHDPTLHLTSSWLRMAILLTSYLHRTTLWWTGVALWTTLNVHYALYHSPSCHVIISSFIWMLDLGRGEQKTKFCYYYLILFSSNDSQMQYNVIVTGSLLRYWHCRRVGKYL